MLNLASQPRENVRPSVLGGDLVLSEHAVGCLRRHLAGVGLDEWRIFQGPMPYLHGIDNVLDQLDGDAVWESTDRSLVGEEPMVAVTFEDTPPSARAWQGGVLHLRRLQVIVARWYWYDTTKHSTRALYLLAAPQVECVETLRQRLNVLNRASDRPVWQICGEFGAGSRIPRTPVGDDALMLPADLRERVETDVIGFFAPPVAAMYRRLNVPYRRGVLLYGAPGNGKTSLIRWAGAKLPHVAALLLRADAGFDTDALSDAIAEWKQLAPAILVIEDLTAVLERVNLSTLLNLLDGVDRKANAGLLLIASTNYPEKLDPALSNRPGRFDVVLELPSPDDGQRRAFLRTRLLEIDLATIDTVVETTAAMSFAHLEEVVHLSGMVAIQGGREFRLPADVTNAADHVRRAFNAARVGYAKVPEVPFGLAGFRKKV